MRTKLIESWITSLADSLGPMRAPIDDKRLTELYHAKDYNGMVARIRALLGLNMRIMLALVNKGGTNAPAWITLPATMPLLGTYEFQNLRVTMYL